MREALAQRVENEFVEAQYPGDENIGSSEVKHFVGQTEWRKVPLEILGRNQSAIISFGLEAYHFYLPAFLCAVLRHPQLEYLEHPIVYSLIPFPTPDTPNRIPEKAVPLFSRGEKSVVVEFLEKHGELFPTSSYTILDDRMAEVQRAITFWKKS